MSNTCGELSVRAINKKVLKRQKADETMGGLSSCQERQVGSPSFFLSLFLEKENNVLF